jgi:Flp pilus assembly protein TadG
MGRLQFFPFIRSKRGQALIEFAFILPFLLVIVGGIVDFGLAFFVGQVIENAAREGARAGAVARPTSFASPLQFPLAANETCTVPCASASPILQVAAAKIPNVNLFNGFNLSYGFFDSPPAPSNQASVQVTIAGSYSWFILQLIGFDPITISRTAEMRWEWQQAS